MNNYPSEFIAKYIYRKRVEIRNKNNNNYNFNKDIELINRRVISILYYGDFFESIKRLFKDIHGKKFGTDAVPSGRAVVFTRGELCDYAFG